MEETQKLDSHMTSAATFVKWGIQDASDDSCSICLDEFYSSDPSTLPVGVNDPELEERIIQHFAAAAAAMGRTHRTGRREGQRRSSTNGRPHVLVLSHPTTQQSDSGSSTQTKIAREAEAPAVIMARPSSQLPSQEEMPPFPSRQNTLASRTTVIPVN
ncbi:RING-H2 group F2A isoform 2 [Hibiscus syriacus]|uniref:RING-H2 group F2A isoform 2 n=1 Tax=Hibiscus syriacus TaxID=106335 RepID=A0A6A3C941_HIBSY|nr:RING-H2 group F2A isoform 2 [Hibiscus syriacus]